MTFLVLYEESILFQLYVELQLALTHSWELDIVEIQLLKSCCKDDPKLSLLKRLLYYCSGSSKAVLALH
jgi:hypothetical protein